MRKAQNKMPEYKEFENLIKSLAHKYSNKNKNDFEELVCIGNLAFVEACLKYNGMEKCKSTFFYRCIDNKMKDWLRKNSTYKRFVVHVKKKDNEENTDLLENICSCYLTPEKNYLFMEGVFSLSEFSGNMIEDLLSNPCALFEKVRHAGDRFLKSAFKQLMIEYGYSKDMVKYAMCEIENYLKEN